MWLHQKVTNNTTLFVCLLAEKVVAVDVCVNSHYLSKIPTVLGRCNFPTMNHITHMQMENANMIKCHKQIAEYCIENIYFWNIFCPPVYQDSGAWLLCWLCFEWFYVHWHHTWWASLLSCCQPEHLQNAQGSQHHFGEFMFLYNIIRPVEVVLGFCHGLYGLL